MNPPVIKKLDENVVNRIAAGEIIQSPMNVLKELIENSIDAKSNTIQITVRSGGLKFLKIQDNGTGIRKEDLIIVCERFTTSKLEKFEDLSRVNTYGFRGEALSSISHIAHLTIQTKTFTEKYAYKAVYKDGKLKSDPVVCTGTQGTTITVEDLFYNLPQRLKIIKSSNEEYQKILDLVSKYAIHNTMVGFSLRKNEETVLRTKPGEDIIKNVRIIYGTGISEELIELEIDDKVFNFKMKGLITNVKFKSRKSIFIFFINNRLVESAALKTAIEDVCSTYFSKSHYPFVYIGLELEPSTVDVNVHPTKHEVKFLNEDEIVEKIKQQMLEKLSTSKDVKILYKQTRLFETSFENKILNSNHNANENPERSYTKDKIRTDSKEQKLDKFLVMKNKLESSSRFEFAERTFCSVAVVNDDMLSTLPKKETKLTSIINMKKNIENSCSAQFRTILKEMVFVGVVNKRYSLFQFETKLFLCDTIAFSRELFYQQLILNFENFQIITMKTPLEIQKLAMIALECKENGWTEEDGPKEILANRVQNILIEKSAIMKEYFGLKITDDGYLETIPVLLVNHVPSMSFLPNYILRLATEVEWEIEEECFEIFCRETADFYSKISENESLTKKHKWIIEHVIYPAFRKNLMPSKNLKKHLFELADLPNLYKVFERC